jgi:hypothetical protein
MTFPGESMIQLPVEGGIASSPEKLASTESVFDNGKK